MHPVSYSISLSRSAQTPAASWRSPLSALHHISSVPWPAQILPGPLTPRLSNCCPPPWPFYYNLCTFLLFPRAPALNSCRPSSAQNVRCKVPLVLTVDILSLALRDASARAQAPLISDSIGWIDWVQFLLCHNIPISPQSPNSQTYISSPSLWLSFLWLPAPAASRPAQTPPGQILAPNADTSPRLLSPANCSPCFHSVSSS